MEQAVIELPPAISVIQVPAPAPTNETKAGTMIKRGYESRCQTLYSISGIGRTAINGINMGTAQTVLSAIGPGVPVLPTKKNFIFHQ